MQRIAKKTILSVDLDKPSVYTQSFTKTQSNFYSKISNLLGLLRIFLHTNALRRILLLLTLKISLMMVIVLTYMAISSLKTPMQPLVASASSKFFHLFLQIQKYIYHNFLFSATLAPTLAHIETRTCIGGMSLYLTTVVSTVMVWSTKLTLS